MVTLSQMNSVNKSIHTATASYSTLGPVNA